MKEISLSKITISMANDIIQLEENHQTKTTSPKLEKSLFPCHSSKALGIAHKYHCLPGPGSLQIDIRQTVSMSERISFLVQMPIIIS